MNTATQNTVETSRVLYGNKPIMHLDELQRVATPEPMGRFHRPVPFHEFAEATIHTLEENGLEVIHDEFEIAHEGNRMFGALEVQPKALEGELITAQDWKTIVGLRGSHDQSIPRGLVIGSKVMVCSNLCFSGDLGTWKTKQTLGVNQRLIPMIQEAVGTLPAMVEREGEFFDRLRNQEMRDRWGDAALVEMHRQGALPGPQLTRAIQEWREPSHPEHVEQAAHDWSAWRLFNATTEALKPTGSTHNSNTHEQRSRVVHGFMSEVVGL